MLEAVYRRQWINNLQGTRQTRDNTWEMTFWFKPWVIQSLSSAKPKLRHFPNIEWGCSRDGQLSTKTYSSLPKGGITYGTLPLARVSVDQSSWYLSVILCLLFTSYEPGRGPSPEGNLSLDFPASELWTINLCCLQSTQLVVSRYSSPNRLRHVFLWSGSFPYAS